MTKKQEEWIQEQIEETEKELGELRDLYIDLRLKRIERELREGGVGTPFTPPSAVKNIDEMNADVANAIKKDPEGFHRYIKKLYEEDATPLKGDDLIPGIPTRDGVAFEEPVTKLQRYKGHPVNPDAYKEVDCKLYLKEPHEDCGGDILVVECNIMGWDHGHARCTKCGKYVGGWISGADGMPFNE